MRVSNAHISFTDFDYYSYVSETTLFRLDIRIAETTDRGVTTEPLQLLNKHQFYGFIYSKHMVEFAQILKRSRFERKLGSGLFNYLTFSKRNAHLAEPLLGLVKPQRTGDFLRDPGSSLMSLPLDQSTILIGFGFYFHRA